MANTFAIAFVLLSLVSPLKSQELVDGSNEVVSSKLYSEMKYRLIGPFRGGRVTAVTGVKGSRFTYYMGSTGGGVWKTLDGGQTWKNISDGQMDAGSIGAIEVAPGDSNVVYVGTGSACPRGNVSPGVGMYKSTDGGKNWNHTGLRAAGQIARIRVHPNDPDLVYVAVLGNVFGQSEERGVYRSEDGGLNWKKVLYVNESTGAVDLAMDVSNPRILYAGMWQVERKPWTLIDGGPDGGVFKTTDGGETWKELVEDLPSGNVGRVGVAVSPADPDVVWVLQEAEDEEMGGLYRSDDGGSSFQRINREHSLRQRAWYYNHVIADPVDSDTVYVMNVEFLKSIDGGKSFARVRVPHGDNHDLWINPQDNRIMINANDGGANISFNGGTSWSTQYNQPTAEFYRVTVDNQFPYRVYGAQQDNSTISVPSWPSGGITPKENWLEVGGGESGHIAVDPKDPGIIYAGSYIGTITRFDRSRWHLKDIVIYPQMHDGVAPKDIVYRFQWNAPIRISPHDSNVLYHASQYVLRSKDEGRTWQKISPDLTSNNDVYQDLPGGPIQHDHTGVELYTTVFAFEESPIEKGVLWAGTDDGMVHVSREDGETWRNITPPEMPVEGTVNMIESSIHAPGRALIAVYRYRRNDFSPYIFLTNDYGEHWRLLTDGKNGIPGDHFVRVVREDPSRKGLLYAGTEFGVYISFDEGSHWQDFQLNLPVTPVTDLQVHQNDLVVATQGRSFWILDDLTPLHGLDESSSEKVAFLYRPRNGYRTQLTGYRGPDVPQSPERGVPIFYYLKEETESEVALDVLDPDGKLIVSASSGEESNGRSLDSKAGMNRWVWDMRYPSPDILEGAVMSLTRVQGVKAPPGRYQVRLRVGEESWVEPFEVEVDPRWESSEEDLHAQFELAVAVSERLEETHDAIRKIRDIRDQVEMIATRAADAGHERSLKEFADGFSEKLSAIEKELIQVRNESRQDPINYPPMLDDQFAYLLGVVDSQDDSPPEGFQTRFDDLKAELTVHLQKLDETIEEGLRKFNRLLDDQGVDRVILPAR